MSPAVLVIAKAPVPGRVKTRLCPPCTPAQAARLAEAALCDTLAAVSSTAAPRRMIALDGRPGRWLPRGFDVVPQRGTGFAERLANAFLDGGGPALLIGMDTPQLQPALLQRCLDTLDQPGTDAVLGHALDGGYWAIGLRRPDAAVFHGVPMSEAITGVVQHARLHRMGLRTTALPPLRDVDRFDDAIRVSEEAPGTGFALTVSAVRNELRESGSVAT